MSRGCAIKKKLENCFFPIQTTAKLSKIELFYGKNNNENSRTDAINTLERQISTKQHVNKALRAEKNHIAKE